MLFTLRLVFITVCVFEVEKMLLVSSLWLKNCAPAVGDDMGVAGAPVGAYLEQAPQRTGQKPTVNGDKLQSDWAMF